MAGGAAVVGFGAELGRGAERGAKVVLGSAADTASAISQGFYVAHFVGLAFALLGAAAAWTLRPPRPDSATHGARPSEGRREGR